MITGILRDVRHAARRLRLSPVYTVTTVATLAFGIALNTVLFSLANVALFRDQAVAEPDQLVQVGWSSPASPERTSAVTWSEFLEISARDDVFSGVIAYKRAGPGLQEARENHREHLSLVARLDSNGSISQARAAIEGLSRHLVAERHLDERSMVLDVFTDTDREGSPRVAVVSSSLARRLAGAPGQAVGQSVVLPLEGDDIVHEVIGVVGDTKWRVFRGGSDQVYLPFDQRPRADMTVVARTPASTGSVTDPLVQLVRAVDPDVAVMETMAITDHSARYFYPFRVSAFVLACLGLGAVAIAGLGVYGVIAFSASLRTREMGIRAALGATRADIVRLVLREAAGIAAVGLCMGLALSIPAGTLATHVVWGLAVADAWVWATVVFFVGAMSLIAAFLPARRAARVDPATALRVP